MVFVGTSTITTFVSVAKGVDTLTVATSPAMIFVSIGVLCGIRGELGSEVQPATIPPIRKIIVNKK